MAGSAPSGPEAALAALERAVAERPLWAEGQVQLARLRRAAGDPDFARGFEAGLAAAPADNALWRHYLACLMFAGRHEAVLAAAARGRALAGNDRLFDISEAVAHDDLGDRARAAALFASLPANDPTIAVYRLRHLLRAGDREAATIIAEDWAATPYGPPFLPYLSLCWRLAGDERWPWLEGDPRLIGVHDLGAGLGPIGPLAALLRRLHGAEAEPLGQSVRGGTQVDDVLSRADPEIVRARAAIVAAVEAYVGQLPPFDEAHPFLSAPRDKAVRLTGSWSVRLEGGGHHVGHVHPGGWLSSAFYVALPDSAQAGPAPAGWLSLGAPPADLGIDLPPLRQIEPKPGRLALFPSTMWHATLPFAAGERLTMAFDVARPA
jgi:hypothetical protein